jgi:hypothetical protein
MTQWVAGHPVTFQTITSAYTAVATDMALSCNPTSTAFALTLPSAVGYPNPFLMVTVLGNTANAVTLTPVLSQTINGTATYAVGPPGKPSSVMLVSDQSNWQVMTLAYSPTVLQTASVLLGTTLAGVSPTAFTTMSTMTTTVSTHGNSKLYVRGAASISEAGTGTEYFLQLYDTSTSTVYANAATESDGLSGGMMQSMSLAGNSGATPLAAGSHTIAMQWKIASSSLTCSSGYAYFDVWEVAV